MEELLLKLSILGWKLDPHFTEGYRKVYDYPDQKRYPGVWIGFYTDKDNSGTISISCKEIIDTIECISGEPICGQAVIRDLGFAYDIRKNTYKNLCNILDTLEK